LVLVIGGVIAVFDATGATFSGINALVEKTKNKKYILIISVLTVFGLLHQVGVAGNTVIAFIPIGIMLARALKLDAIAGIAIVYLGNYAGGATGTLDPMIMGVAQKIAELPLFSGAWFRFIIFIALLFVTIIYVCLYVRKISRDPSRSIIKDDPFPSQVEHNEEISAFTTKHKIIASVFLVFIGIFLFGVFKYDWSTVELAGIFMMMAITVA